MNTELIAVTGATGKIGRRLVRRLLAGGCQVRRLSRRTTPSFDWHDRSTWAAAFSGVESVYLVAPDEPVPAREVVAAAVDAGVHRFVVQSGKRLHLLAEALGAGAEHLGMWQVQQAVQALGPEWTVLQPNNFNQNFSEGIYAGEVGEGRLVLPLDGVVEPFIDAEDIAAAAAAVLTEDGHHGRVYELSGPEALTYPEALAIIGEATGRRISYQAESQERYSAMLLDDGAPRELVDFLEVMYQVMRDGGLADVTDGVASVLGRPPTSFADWAKRTAASGHWS